jgi:hypothetical protein
MIGGAEAPLSTSKRLSVARLHPSNCPRPRTSGSSKEQWNSLALWSIGGLRIALTKYREKPEV